MMITAQPFHGPSLAGRKRLDNRQPYTSHAITVASSVRRESFRTSAQPSRMLAATTQIPEAAQAASTTESVSAAPREILEQVDILERSLQLENDVQDPASTSRSSKRVVEEGELLTSTWEHRLITGGSALLMFALLTKGASEIHSPGEALAGMAACVSAWVVADFLTGIYHWSVDNYGDGNTPIVGTQIAAFQGHHQRPWTITEREFANNVHKVFMPAAHFAALCLAVSPWTPAWLDIGLATATALTCMSQQFHAWAHMKGSDLHPAVKTLQDAGVLVSRKAHGAHHRAPFEGNYSIVSGLWNPVLDAGGDQSFFRRLERLVHERTGVEPRCWSEPTYTVEESKSG